MIGSWAGTKVTLAPVRFSNSARTFLKFFCSPPVHTAATSRLSPSSLGSCTVEPPPLLARLGLVSPLGVSSSPPQPVAASASAVARRTAATLGVRHRVVVGEARKVLSIRKVL